MTTVRPAAVAGMFYPAGPGELRDQVRGMLANAHRTSEAVPKALIAPHAGYVYSGPVAASAYACLRPARQVIRRVVLLGPCHRVPVRGLALSSAWAFTTPLGEVPVDREACDRIAALPQVEVLDAAHAQEHGLEVHLPFLQETLESFTIVPLVVGDATPTEVAQVLELLWDGPETLIVISTDLSHYHDYDSAQALDTTTCDAIENLRDDRIGVEHACGRHPLRGLLQVARRRGLRVETLDVRNSGDTAGTRDSVVGYGAWALHETLGHAGATAPGEPEH